MEYKLIVKDIPEKDYETVTAKIEKQFPGVKWNSGDRVSAWNPFKTIFSKDVVTLFINTDNLTSKIDGHDDAWVEKQAAKSEKTVTAEEYLRTPVFKPGDKVKILDGSDIKNYTGGWATGMRKHIGVEHTVASYDDYDDGRVAYRLEGQCFRWDERGLELVESAEEEKKEEKKPFPVGSKVVLLDMSELDPPACAGFEGCMKEVVGETAEVLEYNPHEDGTASYTIKASNARWYWDERGLKLAEDVEEEKPAGEKTKEDRIAEFRDFMEGHAGLWIDLLTDDLDEMGFFTAPASTRFHGAYEGGLFDHSIAVAKKLIEMTEQMNLEWQDQDAPWLVGMFHDICKCDLYLKQDDGTYKYNEEKVLCGHGDASVIIAQTMTNMPYLDEEAVLCIRYHMGAYEDSKMWKNYGAAIGKYPNVLWTHAADMYVSKVMRL